MIFLKILHFPWVASIYKMFIEIFNFFVIFSSEARKFCKIFVI